MTSTRVTVGGAASVGVARPLLGPERSAEVLGRPDGVMYVGIQRPLDQALDVLALVATDGPAIGLRLPNAVLVPWIPSVAGPVVMGGGAVTIGTIRVRIARWWSPRPRVGMVDHSRLAERAACLSPFRVDDGLWEVLAAGDANVAMAACCDLVGRGAGLTPEGDDRLVGAMAALRLLGRRQDFVEQLQIPLEALASRSTTRLSAALLVHAMRGEVARPIGGLLEALAGRGDVAASTRALLGVGHSSGSALAGGVAEGVRAVVATEGGR